MGPMSILTPFKAHLNPIFGAQSRLSRNHNDSLKPHLVYISYSIAFPVAGLITLSYPLCNLFSFLSFFYRFCPCIAALIITTIVVCRPSRRA